MTFTVPRHPQSARSDRNQGSTAAATEDDYSALFAFAVSTGMRPEEYLALKGTDLDLEAKTATFIRTLVWRKGGGWYFGEPKTLRSRRALRFLNP